MIYKKVFHRRKICYLGPFDAAFPFTHKVTSPPSTGQPHQRDFNLLSSSQLKLTLNIICGKHG